MTLEEFEKLLDQAYTLKLEAEEIGEQKKRKEEHLMELNRVILAEFERLDKSSYIARRCQVIRVSKPTVTTPKEPEKRDAFFKYLKDRNLFEDLVSVNHNTLNAFYKAEFEAAVESGNIDFKIPGLDEPKTNEYLTFRKR